MILFEFNIVGHAHHDFHMTEPSLTCNPVDCNALHPADAVSNHVLSPCLVSLGPANGAQAHVYPIDCVIVCKDTVVKNVISYIYNIIYNFFFTNLTFERINIKGIPA